MSKQTWVSPHNKGWSVKQSGNNKASKIFKTKSEALDYGVSYAKKNHTELISQKKNGKINLKNSYGNDNCPPKG